MSASVFNVLTEFRFEIGSAVTSSKALQGAVENISQAADNTLLSFQKMGMGIVGQLGLAQGGVLGFFYEAISASEKFGQTQRKLANIFLSNSDKIAGGPKTFLESMTASSMIMDEIQRKSQEFGISAGPLANMTALLGAPMFAAGVAGKNLAPAIDIARGVLKTAPVLGVDPEGAQQQVVSMMMGQGNIQDQFVSRLVKDTSVFRELLGDGHGGGKSGGGHGGGALGAFNALPMEKRIKTLTEALTQFASSAEIVEANANSLTQQFQVFKDQLIGLFSIFKPIGDEITKVLAPALFRLNDVIKTNGANIFKQLGITLGKALGTPEEMFENIFQAKSLTRDLKSTSNVFGMAGMAGGIGWALSKIGAGAMFASPLISILGGSLAILFDIFGRMPQIGVKVAIFGAALAAIAILLVAFPPIAGILATSAALLGLFQLFSRAEGIAKVDDLKKLPQITEDLMRIVNALLTTTGRLIAPFIALFDAMAVCISPMFQISNWFEVFSNILFKFVYELSFVEGVFVGLTEAVSAFMTYFTSSQMMTNPLGVFDATLGSFNKEFDRVMNENLSSLTDPEKGAVASQITNIGNVNIHNAFKENMEPDRIAFTLVEQIKKTARNPGQQGRSMSAGLVKK